MSRLLCLMEKNWDPRERSPHPVNTKAINEDKDGERQAWYGGR